MAFVFKLVTPNGVAFEDDIDSVAVPTMAGQIMIYEEHAPLVSVLSSGVLEITQKDKTEPTPIAMSGGVVEVRHTGEVYVLADMALRGEQISEEQMKAARERADELIKEQKDAQDVDFARIQAAIDRELATISVGKKYKKLK